MFYNNEYNGYMMAFCAYYMTVFIIGGNIFAGVCNSSNESIWIYGNCFFNCI